MEDDHETGGRRDQEERTAEVRKRNDKNKVTTLTLTMLGGL